MKYQEHNIEKSGLSTQNKLGLISGFDTNLVSLNKFFFLNLSLSFPSSKMMRITFTLGIREI